MSKEKMEHFLIPEHEKISEKEKEELLKRYNVDLLELPKIKKTDPAIRHLDVKIGDIIRITRQSPTAGKSIFYRVVVNG